MTRAVLDLLWKTLSKFLRSDDEILYRLESRPEIMWIMLLRDETDSEPFNAEGVGNGKVVVRVNSSIISVYC